MEVQDRRRFQHDRRTDHAGRAHEERIHAGEDPIESSEVWRAFTGAIENQQLMLDQERFGHDRPQTAGTHEPSQGGNQVNQQNDQVAHRDILATTPRIRKLDISTDCGAD